MISENAGGHWHGTRREHHIWGGSHQLQHKGGLPGGIIPVSVSKRLRLSEMRCTEYYPVRGRNTFQCRACRHQTSVTAETVMHRTHLPLTVWFWTIYLCATDKRGISAVQLSRALNICYESAWYLLHRIRRAMDKRDEKYALSGIIGWTTAT